MHVSFKAHDPKNFSTSSAGMLEYLTKEEQSVEQARFYNNERDNIKFEEAVKGIDENKGVHGNKVSKFYMINISPSKKELEHIDKLASDIAKDYPKENREQVKAMAYEKMLKEYTTKVMDDYAKNFNRGKTVDDLVYFAKIEHKRTYKEYEKDVRFNENIDKKIKAEPSRKKEFQEEYKRNSKGKIIRQGQEKEGLNSHIHVIVSRYEKKGTQREKASLSPMSKARKSKGLNESKVGFDRSNMSDKAEQSFDKMFRYKRQYNERFKELNREKRERENQNNKSKGVINNIVDIQVNTVNTALKDNKLDLSKIPTDLNELLYKIKWELEKDVKKEFGINPMEDLVKENKDVIKKLDKGVDFGY